MRAVALPVYRRRGTGGAAEILLRRIMSVMKMAYRQRNGMAVFKEAIIAVRVAVLQLRNGGARRQHWREA